MSEPVQIHVQLVLFANVDVQTRSLMAHEVLFKDYFATCFTLRGGRLVSSSRVDCVQASGRKLGKIYYRNDPVKYNLEYTVAWQ